MPIVQVEVEEVIEEEETILCEDCGDPTPESSQLFIDGSIYCVSCCWECDRCANTKSPRDELFYVQGDNWCEECFTDHASICSDCENPYQRPLIQVNGEQGVCNACIEEGYLLCRNCESYYHGDTDACPDCILVSCVDFGCGEEDSEGNDNDGCDYHYAERTAESRPEDRSGMPPDSEGPLEYRNPEPIHSYSYKPDPNFRGQGKLYFGMELEMEIRSPNKHFKDVARWADGILEPAKIAYLKHDASIGNGGWQGFELVTHPMDWDTWSNDNDILFDTLETLRTEYKARSWDAPTCGIHVHMSRDGFNDGSHTHNFLKLIYGNAENMMKFAGRVSTNYATFGDVYEPNKFGIPELNIDRKLRGGGTRSSAINTGNRETLEARFFRGNMKKSGILANIGLLHASIMFSGKSTVGQDDMTWSNLQEYIGAHASEYPDLVERAEKSKVFDLFGPSVSIEA
jgi:hypothetical protein